MRKSKRKLPKKRTKEDLSNHIVEMFDKAGALKGIPTVMGELDAYLEEIFTSDVQAFREILITALAGKFMNPKFKPIRLYDCKPRGLYPIIWKELTKRGIPCGKDGPLNITKAVKLIDEGWVNGRRTKDQPAANAVVEVFEFIGFATNKKISDLELATYKRFLILGKIAKSFKISSIRRPDLAFLSRLCVRLCERAAWAGNTPQRIVSILLQTSNQLSQSNIEVEGLGQSAQATDAGSGKPGDLWEVNKRNKKITHVYEVTVRPVNLKRVGENYQSVVESNADVKSVTFLCKLSDLDDDVKSNLKGGSAFQSGDVVYEFFDIYAWIDTMLERIGSDGRRQFYKRLKKFVREPSTNRKVKKEWIAFHKRKRS